MNRERVKLGDICDTCLGKMLDKAKNRGELRPYLANLNVRWGEFDTSNLSLMKFEDSELERYGIKYGDLVMCEGGEIGRCAIWKESIPNMMIQKALHRIRPKDERLNIFYLMYWFIYQGEIGAIEQYASGTTTIKHLPAVKLKQIEVDLPPRGMQDKIASILSAYDELIDNCKQQIALLEEAAQRLYREWFVDIRFPGHETTAIGENGLPKGWTITILDDVADITMGQCPASSFYNNEKIGLPFHQGVSSFGNIYVVNGTYTSKWTKEAPANSILFSVRAPVGRINLTLDKVALGRGVASINHKDKMQPFLYHYLKHFFYKDDVMGNGTIFSSINKDQLKNVNVLNPSKETMKLFCDVVAPYDTQLAIIDGKLRYLIEARDLLLPRLISGQIEINA